MNQLTLGALVIALCFPHAAIGPSDIAKIGANEDASAEAMIGQKEPGSSDARETASLPASVSLAAYSLLDTLGIAQDPEGHWIVMLENVVSRLQLKQRKRLKPEQEMTCEQRARSKQRRSVPCMR